VLGCSPVPPERLPRRAVRGLGAHSPNNLVRWFFFWSVSSSSSGRASFSVFPGNLLSASAPAKERGLHYDLFGSGRGTSINIAPTRVDLAEQSTASVRMVTAVESISPASATAGIWWNLQNILIRE
jgi:hypothetical protein